MNLYEIDKVQGQNDPDYLFDCPGCGCSHGIWVTEPNVTGARWTIKGSMERPTVRPSIIVKRDTPQGKHLCHLFITNGNIQFLSDCTHKLAGQTLPMEIQ